MPAAPAFPETAPSQRRETGLVAAGTTPLHRLDGPLWVEVVEDPADLARHSTEWDDLARHACEPNVFFERWFLQPAIQTFARERNVSVAFIYRGSRRRDVAPGLVGLFPMERMKGRRFAAKSLQLFGHEYCFLKTPLIREGHAPEVWNALLDWAQRRADVDLLDLPLIRGEGPVAQALVDALHQRRALSLVAETHVRAFLRCSASADDVIAAALSGKQRHEYDRQFRRLAERGRVEYRELRDHGRLDEWISQFLELEVRGWKGAAKTALAQTADGAGFFRAIIRAAADAGRLQALGLWRDDQPIAMKVNLLATPGSFAFKIAYDEAFAKQSPGVQLELENIRRLHEEPSLAWMDSCAAPGHPMINRLWRERTIIHHVLVSTGRIRGNFAVGLRPLIRAGRRLFSRTTQTSLKNPSAKTSP